MGQKIADFNPNSASLAFVGGIEQESTTYWSLKNNRGTQSKTVFKICEGIWCSSFYVNEFDVIVHEKYFLI